MDRESTSRIDTDLETLMRRMRQGDSDAFHELIPLVYDELRRIARGQRRRVPTPASTLNTTALVNEAYLRLERRGQVGFDDRGHFLAVAAKAMRHLLIDEARRHAREKRGGGARPLTLDSLSPVLAVDEQADLLLELSAALDKLAERSPRLAQVVECRFFGGLSDKETAAALGVTDRTVRRDWIKARAWLGVELGLGG